MKRNGENFGKNSEKHKRRRLVAGQFEPVKVLHKQARTVSLRLKGLICCLGFVYDVLLFKN